MMIRLNNRQRRVKEAQARARRGRRELMLKALLNTNQPFAHPAAQHDMSYA